MKKTKKDKWGICDYCKEHESITKDHKTPKADGGSNEKKNIIQSCGACNQLKADLPYDVFIKIPLPVLIRYKGLWKKNLINRKIISGLKKKNLRNQHGLK